MFTSISSTHLNKLMSSKKSLIKKDFHLKRKTQSPKLLTAIPNVLHSQIMESFLCDHQALANLSSTCTFFRADTESTLNKNILKELLQAAIDDHQTLVTKILSSAGPERLFYLLTTDPAQVGISQIESQYTWLRYKPKKVFQMVQLLNQPDMIALFLPYFDKLEMFYGTGKIKRSDQQDDRPERIKQWVLPNELSSSKQKSLQNHYMNNHFLPLIKTFAADDTIQVIWDTNKETNRVELTVLQNQETTLALDGFRNRLLPAHAIDLDKVDTLTTLGQPYNYVDIEQFLKAACKAYDVYFDTFKQRAQRDAYSIYIAGFILSLFNPEDGKKVCEGLYYIINKLRPVSPRAARLQMKDGVKFYRDSRNSHSGAGYDFLCDLSEGGGSRATFGRDRDSGNKVYCQLKNYFQQKQKRLENVKDRCFSKQCLLSHQTYLESITGMSITPEHKLEQSPFKIIYQAAKEKNEQILLQALSLASIDVYHEKDSGSPISKLATEKDIESVNFLLKFNASFGWAAHGFTLSGHKKEAYALLDKIKKEYPDQVNSLLKYMAWGFAEGRFKKEAYALLDKVMIEHPSQIHTVLKYIIFGFARRGDQTEAYALFKKMKIEHLTQIPFMLEYMAAGFARGRHETKVYELLEKVKIEYRAQLTPLLKSLALNFTRSHHKTEAYELLEVVKIDHCTKIASVLKCMAMGFAQGRHKTEVYELFELVKKYYSNQITSILRAMATGFADGGHKAEAYALLEMVKIEYPAQITSVLEGIAGGFAQGWRKLDTDALLEMTKIEHPTQIDFVLKETAFRFAAFGHKTEAYALLEKVKIEYPDSIDSVLDHIAQGFAQSGDKTDAYELLEMVKIKYPIRIPFVLDEIASGFTLGQQMREAYAFLDMVTIHHPARMASVLKWIVRCEEIHDCTDKAVILKTLTMLDNSKARNELANWLSTTVTRYNSSNLAPQATKFNTFMKKQDMTYNQLLGWIQPEMQILLLQGISLVSQGKLNSSLLLSIATYLVPMTLSEVRDLSNKFAMQTCRARFFRYLTKHGRLLVTEASMAPLNHAEAFRT